jgi:hypothetical protein
MGQLASKLRTAPGAVVEQNTSPQNDTGIEIENSPNARVVQNVTEEASDAEEEAES